MKFKHISTGVIVNSNVELPKAMYERVDEPAEEQPQRKRAARKPKEA